MAKPRCWFDVADREACAEALEADLAANGAFFGIVCNAGVHEDAPFPGLKGEAWDRVLRTNLDGFYNVVHPLVMPMVRARNGGRIVTIASASGRDGKSRAGQLQRFQGRPDRGHALTLPWSSPSARITVNSVAPGLIETDMTEGLPAEEVSRLIPMQTDGQARRGRCRRRLLVLARSVLHHRAGDLGQRRPGIGNVGVRDRYDVVNRGRWARGLCASPSSSRKTRPSKSASWSRNAANIRFARGRAQGRRIVRRGRQPLLQRRSSDSRIVLGDELRKFGLRFFMSHDGNRDIASRLECGPSHFLYVPSYQIDRGRFENGLARKALAGGSRLRRRMRGDRG